MVSPRRFSVALQTLATQAGVHRIPLARAPAVQRFLRDALRVIRAGSDLAGGDVERALFWYRQEPLAPFSYQTAEQLVAGHRTDDLLRYLVASWRWTRSPRSRSTGSSRRCCRQEP